MADAYAGFNTLYEPDPKPGRQTKFDLALFIIRPVFWNDPHVEYFYKQNAFLYVGPEEPPSTKNKLVELAYTSYSGAHELTFIHPRKYLEVSFENVSIRQIVRKTSKLMVQRLITKLRTIVDF